MIAATVAPEIVDERLPFARELADVGLDLGSEAVDRDEERELPVRERVEDLSVVAASPDTIAVGHEAELGELLAAARELGDCTPDPGQRQTGIEERPDHAERDQVPEGVRTLVAAPYRDEPRTVPGLELCR